MKKKLIAIVLCLSVIFSLTACGKGNEGKATDGLASEAEGGVEEIEKTEEEVVIEEEITLEPTPEPAPESTEEPTSEPVVYEGIDMESTLPAAEWTQTFLGIIEEPKLLVINDAANKKVILENGEEIQLEAGDVVALYDPYGDTSRESFPYIVESCYCPNEYYWEFSLYEDYEKYLIGNTDKFLFEVTVAVGEGEINLTCALVPY